MKRAAAVALIVAVYLLHQDFWFWRAARPLVFGFLPIGLFYHAAFTVDAGLRSLVTGCSSTRAARPSRSRTNDSRAGRLRLPGVVLYIGIFAFRTSAGASNAEDYFLAGRSLGPAVFLLSLFGANMTAFSILGASGHAFANGIVTFGLMASSSALVIPLCCS